jgi:histidinol-phosphate aminotransferase
VDEAYTEFAGIPSLSNMVISNPNIIIAKTFSKIYGLAGARVGYAIAHPDRIRDIARYQAWPNVSISAVTAAAASAALDHQEFVQECAKRTGECRTTVYRTLRELNLEYIPSSTSFLMFNIDPLKCNYEEAMNRNNIMVQHRKHFGGKWCRVSMGTEAEMATFCKALKSICA